MPPMGGHLLIPVGRLELVEALQRLLRGRALPVVGRLMPSGHRLLLEGGS